MEDRRKKRLVIGLLIFILLLLIAWVMYVLLNRPAEVVPNLDEPRIELPVEDDELSISEIENEREQKERAESSDVIALSKTFVERYGSYSNEAHFANMIDVLPLMTDRFRAETGVFIKTAVVPEGYYGVSTSVVIVDVVEEGVLTAEVLVTTQREESIDSPRNTTVKFQEISLTMIKESGSWYIDSANWQ